MHIVIIAALAFVAGMLLHRYLMQSRAKATEVPEPASSYEASVTAASFDSMVLQTSRETPVLVDFYATWCPPCQYLGPVLAETAKHYEGRFLLAKVDVDAEPALSERYQIKSMPTVMLFRDGNVVAQFVGARQAHSVRFFLAQNGVMPPEQPPASQGLT